MARKIRKQTRVDFNTRIQRLDPAFATKTPAQRVEVKPWQGHQTTSGFRSESPFMMTGLGMALAIAALYAFHFPDEVSAWLVRTGWPTDFLSYATNGTIILTIGFVIFFLGNVVRIFNPRATGRWNAGGLVIGGLAALALFNLPDPYLQSGYALLGFEDANDVFNYAQARTQDFANIDWASVVMVSSSAK